MRAINLLPNDTARSRRGLPSPWVLLAAAAPVVAIGLVYFGYSQEHATVVSRRAELQTVFTQVARLPRADHNAASETGLLADRNQQQAVIEDALSKRMAWDVTLLDIARVLPAGVWLTSLNAESPTPADVATAPPPTTTTTSTTTTTTTTPVATPAPPPQGFALNGNATSEQDVADLLARLSLLPMLSNVTLQSTSSTVPSPSTAPTPSPSTSTSTTAGTSGATKGKAKPAPAPKPVIQFQIIAAVNPAGAGASQ
jgi:Tfp pilus assembly protein PilN